MPSVNRTDRSRKTGKQEKRLPGLLVRSFEFLFCCFPASWVGAVAGCWMLGIGCWMLAAGSLRAANAPSFRNEVQPILARYGCSAGACHGAAAGQGGFKLSLRGYDDEGDYLTITRSAEGRRVNLDDPARSLVLLKATKLI